MTRTPTPSPIPSSEPFERTEIALVVLLVPFLVVLLGLLLTGRRSAAELVLASPFLAIPLAISLLRWHAHRAQRA